MHLIKLIQKALGFGKLKTTALIEKGQPGISPQECFWLALFFCPTSIIGCQLNLSEESNMNQPDVEFWNNLVKLQLINEKIKTLLKYRSEDDSVPMDLNHVKDQTEIESFRNWAIKLEDKALEMAELAESITLYPALMQEDFDELESDALPDEGNPGVAVGG